MTGIEETDLDVLSVPHPLFPDMRESVKGRRVREKGVGGVDMWTLSI